MPVLIAGVVLFLLLAGLGRTRLRARSGFRLAAAFFAALAAAGCVASVLKGSWLVAMGLLLVSGLLAQEARAGSRGRATTAMSPAQARSILGVGEGAQPAEIEEAWRRLIRRAHPDIGGTVGLAAQLNAARDRLLPGRR